MLLPLLFSWSTNQKSERVELWAKSYREREDLFFFFFFFFLCFLNIYNQRIFKKSPFLLYNYD